MLDMSDDFALWIFVINPSFLQSSCRTPSSKLLLSQKPAGVFVRHIEPKEFQQLQQLCHICNTAVLETDLFNASLAYLLHLSWHMFQKGSVLPLVKKIHPAVQQVAHILLNGAEKDDLSQLAQSVGLTPEAVSRLFKNQTGINLSTFRNRCRLERFLALYGDGHTVTMLEAALAAGFGSYAQFYRVFCKMMRQTPAEYRRGIG